MNTHTAHDEIARLEAGLELLGEKYGPENADLFDVTSLIVNLGADVSMILEGFDARDRGEWMKRALLGAPPKPVSEWTEQECRDWLAAHPVPPRMPPGDDPRSGDPIPSLYSANPTNFDLGYLIAFSLGTFFIGILLGMLL